MSSPVASAGASMRGEGPSSLASNSITLQQHEMAEHLPGVQEGGPAKSKKRAVRRAAQPRQGRRTMQTPTWDPSRRPAEVQYVTAHRIWDGDALGTNASTQSSAAKRSQAMIDTLKTAHASPVKSQAAASSTKSQPQYVAATVPLVDLFQPSQADQRSTYDVQAADTLDPQAFSASAPRPVQTINLTDTLLATLPPPAPAPATRAAGRHALTKAGPVPSTQPARVPSAGTMGNASRHSTRGEGAVGLTLSPEYLDSYAPKTSPRPARPGSSDQIMSRMSTRSGGVSPIHGDSFSDAPTVFGESLNSPEPAVHPGILSVDFGQDSVPNIPVSALAAGGGTAGMVERAGGAAVMGRRHGSSASTPQLQQPVRRARTRAHQKFKAPKA